MRRFIGLVSALLLIAAACASGDDPADSDASPSGADATPSATVAAAPDPDPTPAAVADPTPTPDEPAESSVRTVASSSAERAPVAADAPVAELADGFNRAGLQLWSQVVDDTNFVFSPASITHTLLMARAAADDTTGAAIDAALALPAGPAAHDAWNSIDQGISRAAEAEDEVTVSIADAIFPRLDVEPDQAWVDLLATHHGAEVQALDFGGDPSGSRDHINGWVSDRTEALIPELLPEGFIKEQTVLVLADALYFEARWQRVFGKYGPETAAFTRLDGSTTDVEFMVELELPSLRGVGDGFVAAEVPYVGGEFSMLVIVPDDGRFTETRDRLFAGDLMGEADAVLETGPFELWLPRWETTSELNLIAWLESIGAAPGSYPSITPDAFLGDAVHAADIAVDEWGTVAAAATAFGFDTSGGPDPDLVIKADKPFLYLIRHQDSGLVLFTGQVMDPTA